MARIGIPFPEAIDGDVDELRLAWHRWAAGERSYIGDCVRWADVSGVVPGPISEVRLRDGRTLLVAAAQRERLDDLTTSAGVPWLPPSDVWSDLLAPFLDNSDEPDERLERFDRLRAAGLPRWRVKLIRACVAPVMIAELLITWEWLGYLQHDLIVARATFRPTPGWGAAWRYRRFRRWTDRIARGRDEDWVRAGAT